MSRARTSRMPSNEEVMRLDALPGWPSPEERTDWLGEASAERTLLEAFRSGRMHHAWLIGGPKGIGKATLAYRFARFVLAHPDPTSPEVMEATDLSLPPENPVIGKVAARAHANLLILERGYDDDRKRHYTELTVDQIRRTVSFFGSTAGEPGWRVAIVDPADDMNASAANALLKILEEPPSRALFLIVSHAPGSLVPTIRSRCRRLELRPLSGDVLESAILANAEDPPSSDDLRLAISLSDGSLRTAVRLLDGGGLDLYRDLSRILSGLPRLDVEELHGLADRVGGRGGEEANEAFLDGLRGWLSRRIRRENEPESLMQPASSLASVPLERWAEVWENLRHSSALAEALNLDKRQAVLSILMSLARATRM